MSNGRIGELLAAIYEDDLEEVSPDTRINTSEETRASSIGNVCFTSSPRTSPMVSIRIVLDSVVRVKVNRSIEVNSPLTDPH